MSISDRDRLIAALDRLGSAEDAAALAAAREAHAMLQQENLTWDALIVRPDAVLRDLDEADDGEPGHVHADPAPESGDTATGDAALDKATIERLLALSTLSPDTRTMLEDLKSDVAEGLFSAADRRYLQGLERRLNPGKSAGA